MIQVKWARRQAYRYGVQTRELARIGTQEDLIRVNTAYGAFLRQFDGEDSSEVILDWLNTEFQRGVEDAIPLGELTISVDQAARGVGRILHEMPAAA